MTLPVVKKITQISYNMINLDKQYQKPVIKAQLSNQSSMEINDGHYLELMDRLHVVCSTIDNHILKHPLTEVNSNIKIKIENALELLYDVYQDVGNLDT